MAPDQPSRLCRATTAVARGGAAEDGEAEGLLTCAAAASAPEAGGRAARLRERRRRKIRALTQTLCSQKGAAFRHGNLLFLLWQSTALVAGRLSLRVLRLVSVASGWPASGGRSD